MKQTKNLNDVDLSVLLRLVIQFVYYKLYCTVVCTSVTKRVGGDTWSSMLTSSWTRIGTFIAATLPVQPIKTFLPFTVGPDIARFAFGHQVQAEDSYVIFLVNTPERFQITKGR
jgi:hypothetical protein